MSEPGGPRAILGDRAVRTIILINFLVMVGFGLIAPILPLFARSFGVGLEAAGLLISAFAIARLVFDLAAGPIVDRFGERVSAATGLGIVAVSSALTGLAPTFTLAVLFRAAGGAGSSILFAALYSYVLKTVPKDRMGRTLSLFYGSFNAGIIAGGPLGGVIAHALGLRAPLFAYAGVLVLAAMLYLVYVRDPPRTAIEGPLTIEHALIEREAPIRRAASQRVMERLRDRRLIGVLIVNLSYFWIIAGVYDTLVPLFGSEALGMSAVAIGGVFSIALATESIVLYPSGKAADTIGRKPVMVFSLVGVVTVTAVIGLAGSPLMLGLMLGLMGIVAGVAGVPPAAMLSDIVPEEASGTAVGLFRFAGDLGFVLGPLVAGYTSRALGFTAAFAIAAVMPAIALVAVLVTPETLATRRRLRSGEL